MTNGERLINSNNFFNFLESLMLSFSNFYNYFKYFCPNYFDVNFECFKTFVNFSKIIAKSRSSSKYSSYL